MRTRAVEDVAVVGLGEDEELGEGRSWPRWLSPRQTVGAIVALALVVGIVAAGHVGGHKNAATPTPVPSGSLDPDYENFRPLSLNDIALHCPVTIQCTSQETVPTDTLAAVHEYLPGSFERRTLTINRVTPDRLYYRAVNATSGLVELLIIISTPDRLRGAERVTLDPHPGAAIRYVRRDVGRYEVQVQYTGPPGGTPAVDLAQRLAADPRLLIGS